jgi:uncharacterized protein YbbC (DUF1343 family)
MSDPFLTGLDCCVLSPPAALAAGARFGLLLNQASVDARLRLACDVLAERFPGQLTALFSPQHGLWGEEQANMIESPHSRYAPLDLPIYSLYSRTRRPTAEMLRGLDCLVIDLQDVGTRIYTFIWTVQQCLFACAEAGVRVILLDRPNPLGRTVEGPILDPKLTSFVGGWPIPLRHGLTLGELARLIHCEQEIDVELEVVPMSGWQPDQPWPSSRPWIWPSPNVPRLETTLVYPGQVLLEGTNLSEGRGTTLPFEVCGAPFIDPQALVREMQRVPPPGVMLRPIRFVPTFDKWRGERCGGVALHVTDPVAFRPVATTVQLLAAVAQLYPSHFAWLLPPYEYEYAQGPISILYGTGGLQERLSNRAPLSAADIEALTAFDEVAWSARTAPCRMY